MITKILNGWRISFFFNLMTFIVQQLGLYYILFEYNKLILLLCTFDIYIFIHFCFNNSQSFAAVKGGNCWILYVYSISFKVIFMYFFAFNENAYSEETNTDYYNKCVIFALLSLSTLIYTALSVKSYKQLYPDEMTITNEHIFHNNLILHVVIDLFDIFELLFTLVKLSYIVKNTNFWIKIIGGVLISFSLYLNAYSFPIISLVTEKSRKNLDLGDIYFCKKHAAVVGIILVDIPFMILRFYFLASYVSNVHFQPLLIKNVCFIPIKCLTIKHCNLIFERLRRNIDHTDNGGRVENTLAITKHTNSNNNTTKPDDGTLIPYGSLAGSMPNVVNRPSGGVLKKRSIVSLSTVGFNNSLDIKSVQSLRNEAETQAGYGHASRNRKITTVLDAKQDGEQVNGSGHTLNYPNLCEYFENLVENQVATFRKLNVKKNKIGKKFTMNKLMYTNVSNNERYHCYLDDSLKVSYLNQIRLIIPYVTYCLGKIAMSIVIYFFYTQIDIHGLKIILTQSDMYYKLFEHNHIMFTVSFLIILGNSVISFLSSVFLSSILEVLFFTLFIFVKCTSDFLFLLLLVYNNIFEIFLRNLNKSEKYAPYFYLLFAVIPSFKIIRNIYVFLCSLSGRQFIGYIIRPFMNETSKSKLPPFLNINGGNTAITGIGTEAMSGLSNTLDREVTNGVGSSPPSRALHTDELNLFDKEESSQKNNFKGDYKGFISIASLLIYINTKHMHGLSSLSTLMIGNNFIKNLRLNYNLKNNHLLLIVLTLVTRFLLLLFICMHHRSKIWTDECVRMFYCGVTFIFMLDLIFKVSYLIVSHNIRMCASYNLHLKSMYEDVYYNAKARDDLQKNHLKDLHSKYQMNHFYVRTVPLFSEIF
ncbi:conserved Plasmodium protein, unknown function [Plasmodium knowlesi strain H]|uniref:TMEM121 domain-containing protein n=3 Tax=Plasmodium knowlesi TaxID=5850 RepID=A0A5K1VQD8_PLAKH|nr:TMEM121 domain-containing protein, putative [Plasmodium knowlesi strain H]OTN66586.1 Uncharacterized protein PKNOH_S08505000 [Plasmodium knowlesi]CAA9986681.1 TMEM121 domain-containing protein, putative [Plasmodium knowlesi strain H]SBO23490.1 conserved Plasmodium protein, unknown function [Plasmodium knowlesi strain H]SBO24966.1 conserved Plasmodium protein, unknown function [Plasmodium knowlesi strain H]VVS76155.1 TMEM121 domain-containing protein, putative [Plasmodium knowlesi strain H]|eukprot:XP_002257867.1 hypothetical protein, conserved in Plasmodium species [Plasmodium knowlesi strain H]